AGGRRGGSSPSGGARRRREGSEAPASACRLGAGIGRLEGPAVPSTGEARRASPRFRPDSGLGRPATCAARCDLEGGLMGANAVLRVVQTWHQTIIDDKTFKGRHVVVGHGPRGHFLTPSLGLPALYALFSKAWRGWRVALGPGMAGEISVSGDVQPVADILSSDDGGKKKRKGSDWRAVPLTPGDWGLIRMGPDGEHGFFFQITPKENRIPAPQYPWHGDTLQSWGLSVVFHSALLALTLLFLTWPPPNGSTLGGYVIHLSQQPPKIQEKKEKKKEPSAGVEDGADKAKPTATADKEGKQGGKGEKQRAASPKADPKQAMVDKVKKVGVLAHANVLNDIAGGSPPTLNLPINRL